MEKEKNNPILMLIKELSEMTLEELEILKPEFLARLQELSEPARNVGVKAIELVIEQKQEQLEKLLQVTI